MAVLRDDARAQDVVQDVFLRLWRRPESFDERRGPLGAYLRLMARSRAVDMWRETQAAGRAGERLSLVADRPATGESGEFTAAIERQALGRALGRLPDGQREAVVLTVWGGLTAAELADHAAVPLGTAKSRVRLGLTKLRRAYRSERAAA
jgi:RNA polymerase sigma-70 factor (ECF subfamily)